MTTYQNDYLAHHGIKGQKWGQRRYQNLDGSLTAEGRKRLGYSLNPKGNKKESSVKKLVDMAKSKRAEKAEARKAEKEAAEKQKRMDYYRDHPEQMYKHRKELKPAEVDEIMRNVQFDRRLKDISDQENRKNAATVQSVIDKVNTAGKNINNLYGTGKNIWNNIAEVNNALIDFGVIKDGRRLTKIGEKKEDETYAKLLKDNDIKGIIEYQKNLSNNQLFEANKRATAIDQLNNRLKNNTEQKQEKEQPKKKDTIGDDVREAGYSNSPTKIMKAMSGANAAEKEFLEKQMKEYEEVVDLMKKYR